MKNVVLWICLFVDFVFDFAQATERILSIAEVFICEFVFLCSASLRICSAIPCKKNVAIRRFPSEGKCKMTEKVIFFLVNPIKFLKRKLNAKFPNAF